MGRLIVFEGIDGSGKSTQFRLLCDRLAAEGLDFRRIVFPQYAEPSSALLRMYLNGEFGADPGDVNSYAASTFFAVDRYASYVKVWRSYYLGGGLLLADRYTTSNAIHQGSKLPAAERADFFRWLYDFEFRLLGLPKPDAVLYMDVSLDTSLSQIRRRESETNTKGDIHEADSAYLAKCLECGSLAADMLGWSRIRCESGGAMLPAEDIHERIYARVKEVTG